MLLDIVKVNPRPDFQLDLIFENGEQRRFDMRPLLSIKPWIANPHIFPMGRGGLSLVGLLSRGEG